MLIYMQFIWSLTIRETVELVKRAEVAGASWVTVHGRTVKQRNEPSNTEAIKTVSNEVKYKCYSCLKS